MDNNFNGPGRSSDCRPNIGTGAFTLKAGGLNPITHSVQYFTPSTTPVGTGSSPFGRPAFATFGNIGRNPFVGPRQYMADAAITVPVGAVTDDATRLIDAAERALIAIRLVPFSKQFSQHLHCRLLEAAITS